ncbi:hypothetical protein F4777DRAFT_14739 [Nemania sp. FL0916]|nr:hypothetical protein F4777DRAFT_14739 [Nemania sp. FL0916]
MASYKVGFYAVIVFAALKLAFVAFETAVNIDRRTIYQFPCLKRHKLGARLALSKFVLSILLAILGAISFIEVGIEKPSGVEGLCTHADADIVGPGIRIGTWILVGVLSITAFLGVFVREAATKELGAGLLITHVSLAIALIVPLARRDLPPIDAILGSLILDAQGAALSIQLTAKETLASRWQSVITPLIQLLGYTIEGFLVTWFSKDWLTKDDQCSCFTVFWWSWFSNCPNVTPNTAIPFWIYFGLRGVHIIHNTSLAILQLPHYDSSKKWDAKNSCAPCDFCFPLDENARDEFCKCVWCVGCNTCKRCNGISHDPHNVFCNTCAKCSTCHRLQRTEGQYLVDGRKYSEKFMTISPSFFESGVLSFLSLAAAEATIGVNNVQQTSPIYSVGQVTALVIAIGTGIRACWVILYQFVPPIPAPGPAHQPPAHHLRGRFSD